MASVRSALQTHAVYVVGMTKTTETSHFRIKLTQRKKTSYWTLTPMPFFTVWTSNMPPDSEESRHTNISGRLYVTAVFSAICLHAHNPNVQMVILAHNAYHHSHVGLAY